MSAGFFDLDIIVSLEKMTRFSREKITSSKLAQFVPSQPFTGGEYSQLEENCRQSQVNCILELGLFIILFI